MALAALILLAPLAQGGLAAPEAAPPQEPVVARGHKSWEELSPEEQRRMRERFQRYQELPEEARQELQRRYEALEYERRKAWFRLGREDRDRLEGLSELERRKFLDGKVREHLEYLTSKLEKDFPNARERLASLPLEERFRASREMLGQVRRKQMRDRIQEVVNKGWLGPQAASLLENAPLHEAMEVVNYLSKWEQLTELRASGQLELWGLDEEEQERLADFHPMQFLFAVRKLREGKPKDEVLSWGNGRSRWGGWERDGRDRSRFREGDRPEGRRGPSPEGGDRSRGSGFRRD